MDNPSITKTTTTKNIKNEPLQQRISFYGFKNEKFQNEKRVDFLISSLNIIRTASLSGSNECPKSIFVAETHVGN